MATPQGTWAGPSKQGTWAGPARGADQMEAGGGSSWIVPVLMALQLVGSAAQGAGQYSDAKSAEKERKKREKMQGGDFNATPVSGGQGNYLPDSILMRLLGR